MEKLDGLPQLRPESSYRNGGKATPEHPRAGANTRRDPKGEPAITYLGNGKFTQEPGSAGTIKPRANSIGKKQAASPEKRRRDSVVSPLLTWLFDSKKRAHGGTKKPDSNPTSSSPPRTPSRRPTRETVRAFLTPKSRGTPKNTPGRAYATSGPALRTESPDGSPTPLPQPVTRSTPTYFFANLMKEFDAPKSNAAQPGITDKSIATEPTPGRRAKEPSEDGEIFSTDEDKPLRKKPRDREVQQRRG